jgi:hypothetical protein
MHKGKKIVLLPLTPAKIVKHDKKLAKISKNYNALHTSGATSAEIKLKGRALIAKTSMNAENYMQHHIVPCFADMFRFHMIIILCLAICVLLSLTFCRSLMVGWS